MKHPLFAASALSAAVGLAMAAQVPSVRAQGANPPSVKMSGTRNLKGEAKLERTDSFLARITAEVVDVKPNAAPVGLPSLNAADFGGPITSSSESACWARIPSALITRRRGVASANVTVPLSF